MSDSKQSQQAGDNSQLVQAGTINVYNGIDEKRAREICAETYAEARKVLTADAYTCANERVRKFEESLFSRLSQIEEALSNFSDPAFQFLLTSAQKTAAASERDTDYDMLSELLACRIQKGQSRKTRTGISKAVEIIDKIDDDALCALTVIYVMKHIKLGMTFCKSGVKKLADLFEKLIYIDLPSETDWIDHLDILDAARINNANRFMKIEEFCLKYVEAGIKTGSNNHKKAMELLMAAGFNSSALVKNEFLADYVKLPIGDRNEIKSLKGFYELPVDGVIKKDFKDLNEKEIKALETIWDLYTKDTEAKARAKKAFMNEWDSYPSLKKLHVWWDKLPYFFDITHAGTVLAHTNARRCDENIPELPLPA